MILKYYDKILGRKYKYYNIMYLTNLSGVFEMISSGVDTSLTTQHVIISAVTVHNCENIYSIISIGFDSSSEN